MTTARLIDDRPLPRPPASSDAGPADERFHDAVEARFRRVVANDPLIGTWLGLHDLDARLADPSRDAVIQQIGDERAHLGTIEAIDPSELSAAARFERDIELHNVRRELFDLEELRLWERRSFGARRDRRFALPALRPRPRAARRTARRDLRPARGGRRLPGGVEDPCDGPAGPPLAGARDRGGARPARPVRGVRRGRDRRACSARGDTPGARRGVGRGRGRGLRRLAARDPRGRERRLAARPRAPRRAGRAIARSTASMRTQILEIGWQKLAEEKTARVAAAREIDPDADEADGPRPDQGRPPGRLRRGARARTATSMLRARQHLIDRDLVTVPDDERIDVIETPEYLRNVIPFAAYFSPAQFDPDPKGIYVVTPSVGDDPDAMREHNLALDQQHQHPRGLPGPPPPARVARRHPSLTRLADRRPRVRRGLGHVLASR